MSNPLLQAAYDVPMRGGGGINWIALDRFLTDLAAGNVDGTDAEPGPGVRNVDETDGQFSISSGVLNIPAQTTPVWGDLGLWYTPALTRAAGLMLQATLNIATWEEFGLCLHTSAAVVDPDSAEAAVQLNATDGQLDDETGEQIYHGLSTSTDYVLRLIARSTGHFIMFGNTLIRIARAGATATLYAMLSSLDAVLTADNVGDAQLPITIPALYPIPTVSDTFSDETPPLVSDGLAHVEADGNGSGVTWTGDGTFTNSSNKAYVDADAALGAELHVSANAASDPNGNEANAITGWSDVSGTLSSVTDPSVGTYALKHLNTSGLTAARMEHTVSGVTAGNWYKITFDAKRVNASKLTSWSGLTPAVNISPGAAYQSYSLIRRSTSTSFAVRHYAQNLNDEAYTDNVSIKLLMFEELLRAVSDTGQPYTAVAMTITADTQAGVMINLDSVTNPQNGIRVWYDRTDSKVYAQELIAGVWQADSLAGVSATYGAGDLLEVRRIGNEVYVFCGGAYIGNFTASSSNANTLTSIWATDNASYFEDFESFPATGYDYGAYA